jgi:hypothetical protein
LGNPTYPHKTVETGAPGPGLHPGERALEQTRDKIMRNGLDFFGVNSTSAFGGDQPGIFLLDSSGELSMKIPAGLTKFAAAWLLLKAAALRFRP